MVLPRPTLSHAGCSLTPPRQGCLASTPADDAGKPGAEPKARAFVLPPPWAATPAIARTELARQRDEFWTTLGSGAYGGQPGAPSAWRLWPVTPRSAPRECSPHSRSPALRTTEIWSALKAAVESDLQTARIIIDSAGVVVDGKTLARCFDERGALYELPLYVLSAPRNLLPG